MKKKYLIFETNVGDGGHHLEFLHHYYIKAIELSDFDFVFVVPEKFKETKLRFEWPEAQNISFDYLSDVEYLKYGNLNGNRQHFYVSKLIKKYVKRHGASHVFLSTLQPYMIFLPFVLPSNARVSGIIYKVYLYEWKQMSLARRIAHIFLNYFITHNKTFDKLFVLNDLSAVCFLNRLYRTNKYHYTADPIVVFETRALNIRKDYDIPGDAVVFLQCGMQTRRKMSLDILRALSQIAGNEKLCFVFAGRIKEEIKEEFYQLYEKEKERHRLIIVDRHLSYDEMFSFLDASNYVFVLYENSSQSSGFIGHAAFHNKPVLSIASGMIGKLVKKYRLGYSVQDVSPTSLAASIVEMSERQLVVSNKYSETHQVSDFAKNLFN